MIRRPVLLLSVLSGTLWGLAGFLIVGDTNMADIAWVGLAASPAIGLLIGCLAVRTTPRGLLGRAFIPLINLYIAVGLFATVLGIWRITAGWNDLAVDLQSGSRREALFNSIVEALLGFTGGGYVLMFWPASIANHFLIWARLRPHVQPVR